MVTKPLRTSFNRFPIQFFHLSLSFYQQKKINEGLQKNFTNFINEYRINAVIRHFENPDYNNITLLGIAYDCGFNSKTTFNRVFKKLTNKTPLEYKKSIS